MYEFEYSAPRSVDEAVARRRDDEDALFLAGGMSLIPILKQRLAMPTEVVDLGRIPDIKGITLEAGTLTIGAMTPHAVVAASPEVGRALPALAKLAGGIGDPHVRNRGTIGGSLAHSDPAADYPSSVLGLNATVVTDRREIAADDFFVAMMETALEPGEMITRVRYPLPEVAGYARFDNPASRFPIVAVMVAKTGGGVRVAVTGAGPKVFRVEAMERALAADFAPAALDGITVPADGLNEDIHATAEYRAHMVGEMARRAVAHACEIASKGSAR